MTPGGRAGINEQEIGLQGDLLVCLPSASRCCRQLNALLAPDLAGHPIPQRLTIHLRSVIRRGPVEHRRDHLAEELVGGANPRMAASLSSLGKRSATGTSTSVCWCLAKSVKES